MSSEGQTTPVARILVADDDRLVLSTLSAGLARAGYAVQAVDNGAEAAAACAADPPDLVVLDHNMPGLSGLEAARRILAQTDIPILMLTAYDDADLVRQAVALGVCGYFVKPIDSSQLVPSIELHLMRARQARAAAPAAGQAGARDPLTGLLHRDAVMAALSAALAQGMLRPGACAGVCLDIDRFRALANHCGRHVADGVLQQVVERIRGQLRQDDVLARLGEHQFFLVLSGMDIESAIAVARRVLAAIGSRPFHVPGRTGVSLSACAGLSLADGQSGAEGLIARAAAALQEAKTMGAGSLCVLEAGERPQTAGMSRYERLIRGALDHDRIGLEFQPILDIRSGEVRHYEALLRLAGEDGAPVALPHFLPAAERYGLIRALDYRVLELAVAHLATLDSAGRAVSIAVNISGVHFGNPALLRRIREILAEHALDARRLIFEVTETAAVRDLEQAGRFIAELKALGCQFALDDFGAGYASFYYLKGLPVDYIKIDGAFVRDLARTASDRLFVKAMVDVARGLGVKTIAEYVGDAQTLELLRGYGVDFAQGFFIGRPGPLPPAGGMRASAATLRRNRGGYRKKTLADE